MSELPRLLLCSFDVIPAPSGSSRRLTEYLKGLSDHFNVVVLSAKTPDHSHIQKFEGARLLRVPVGSGDLVSRLQAFDRAVRRQLESEEYVVAHFTDPFGGYALCELRESYGYKLVYEAQSFPSQELRSTHPQLDGDRKFLAKIRRQELFCLMNADRVITGSEVTRSFIQSLGVAADHIEVIRAPVDLSPYTPEDNGLPDATPMRVLYLGSQVPWQGLSTLLRATRIALETVDLRLVLVGPAHSAYQPLLQDLIDELRLGNKVELQPPVAHEDLHKLLATADVGVVPIEEVDRNRVQGGALAKVAEYLAAGRPVIASDLDIAREILPDEVALFHEPGDPEDLAECLVALANNPKRRVKMGQAAFELARVQHDASAIRERVRAIYLEVTGLSPAMRRDADDSDGPAPTQIGTPMSRADLGTDPAARVPSEEDRRAAKAAAERRKERRRKRREETDSAASTDPAASRSDAPQVVMGTPLHEDAPLVEPDASIVEPEPPLLQAEPVEARTLAADHAFTEPAAAHSDAPPVVMGTPVHEHVQAEPPFLQAEPPFLQAELVEAPVPTPPPLPAVLSAPRMPEGSDPEEPAEIDPDEVVDLLEVDSDADPEPIVSADDAVLEAVEDSPVAIEASPEPESVSRMDAWFAQLVHGYCPPEGAQFARPTPPTNFPGREGPPPPTVQPPSPTPQSFPTRSGGG